MAGAHTIKSRDGERMSWPLFRGMMTGQILPSKAVAAQRRSGPAGAYDAKPRWARDQQTNGGRLDKVYCDATRKFLGDNGVPEEDVDAVMKILGKYQAEDDDPVVPVSGQRGPVPGPEPAGNQDKAMGRTARRHRTACTGARGVAASG